MSTNVEGLRARVGAGPQTVSTANRDKQGVELQRVGCYLTESLWKRVLRKIFPDQRKSERLPVPPLVGYLGTVRASKPYELGDISSSGFCLLTDERWTPGTEMPVTLQMTNPPEQGDGESFTVQATVVRNGNDGVGFSIVLSEEDSAAAYGNPLQVRWISKPEMDLFMRRLKEPSKTDAAQADPSAETRATPELAPVFQISR